MSYPSPSKQQLELIDIALFSAMRAKTTQDVLFTAMGPNAPTNPREYAMAYKEAQFWLLRCQPNCANEHMKSEQAFQVIPNCPVSPYDLIALWARIALLGIALGNFHDGLGNLLATLETACQFGNDDLLLVGVKLSFAVATRAIFVPEVAKDLSAMAGICEKVLTSQQDEPCARTHSERVRDLGANFYMILEHFGMLHAAQSMPMTLAKEFLGKVIESYAEEVDKATNRRFQMKDWVKETLKAF
ncbi:hypothetical protein HYV22_03660 [Candidatus Gottesmanbacteria bacterium]|nr:hypothetical protein [Candidatus Gottesmanbacteria bacterium]